MGAYLRPQETLRIRICEIELQQGLGDRREEMEGKDAPRHVKGRGEVLRRGRREYEVRQGGRERV
jgi:hypothetical protein